MNDCFFNIKGELGLRSKSYLSNLYIKQDLSKREIARQLNINHSTIIEALRKAGIHKNISPNKNKRKGQIPFGYDYKNRILVENKQEQEIIRIIRQLKIKEFSLRETAEELNKKLIPTKNNGIWQANTIRKILQRFKNKTYQKRI